MLHEQKIDEERYRVWLDHEAKLAAEGGDASAAAGAADAPKADGDAPAESTSESTN